MEVNCLAGPFWKTSDPLSAKEFSTADYFMMSDSTLQWVCVLLRVTARRELEILIQ